MPYDIQANIDILLNIVKKDPSEVENEKIKLLDITIFNCILNIDSDNPALKEIDYKYKLTQKNIENDGFNTILPDSDDIQIGYSYSDGGNILLAPNGKPSNLTPEQYKLVRTPEFKAWFGDWENDTENASKVVDSNGEPMVCYHATRNDFTIFEQAKNTIGAFGKGIYFANSKEYASDYNRGINQKILSVFLNIKKIIIIKNAVGLLNDAVMPIGYERFSPNRMLESYGMSRDFTIKAKSENYNGVIAELNYGKDVEYVAFESNQIKLADGSNTTFDGANPDIRYADGGSVLLAPNGKPSNLTPEQYKLVRTPEFKAWFGEWENSPQTASKVVDSNGEPLVVYHGTDAKFTIFDVDKIASKNKTDIAKLGFWFTQSLWEAEGFAFGFDENYRDVNGIVLSCFLKIINPLYVNDKKVLNKLTDEYPNKYLTDGMYLEKNQSEIKKIISKKNDGIILGDIYIVKNTNQIKLADGTNTTFDGNNADIRYEKGGSVLLAPNGKPSNLTPEQYKLVRTPEFKAWFGDWENDSESASKVVDDNGEPLVVYHGSSKIFNEFEPKFLNAYSSKPETHFINYIDYAEGFGNNIYECFLDIKTPEYIYKNGEKKPYSEESDGTIILNFLDSKYKELQKANRYAVFSSYQIKLADGSNTTFDGSNPDIRYEKGGSVADHKEIYQKWKSLVNMNKNELKAFYDSQEGKDAGLTNSQANELGIHNGRESARWIMKMKDTPNQNWTPEMWDWANRQISFISRMKGNKGDLYDSKGNKTRKHTSLLIWGHNPEKYNTGGDISHPSPYANFLIDEIMVRYSEKFPNDTQTETTKNNLHDMWMRIEKERGSQRADGTLEEVLMSYFPESTKAGGYQMIKNKFEKSGWRIKSKMRELLDIYTNLML